MDNFLLAQYPLLSVLAHTLVHALWQITLLALLAAFSFVQLRRQSAAMRHAVGLFFLLAAPLLTVLTFAWLWSASVPGAVSIRAAALPTPPLTLPAEIFLQRSDWFSLGLSLLWLLGAVIMLLRQFGGWWLIAELDRQAHRDLPSAWQAKLLSMQQAMAISRTVTVRVAAHVNSPFTARLLRPVIWFPATLLTRLPAEQVEMLLAHELAHVCRLDWLWNGLQCVVESLFFFHPGVWWLSRRIREEREHACDDLAVAVCGNAIALAEALAALEQQRHDFPRLALAAHGGSLMQRITRLLSNSSQRPRWRTPAALLGLLCTTMLFASQMELLSQNLVGLRIEESTDGMLMPGDYREITANDTNLQRYYHVSVDAQWRHTEIYKEAGMVKPIDDSVRAWLAKVDALRVMPSPPDIPALPPAPMSPPELTESELFQDLLKVVLADSRVGQVVGTPVQVRSEDVHGHLRAWGDNNSRGESTLAFVITGPKGRVQVKLSGLRDESVWHLAALDVVPTP